MVEGDVSSPTCLLQGAQLQWQLPWTAYQDIVFLVSDTGLGRISKAINCDAWIMEGEKRKKGKFGGGGAGVFTSRLKC